MTAAWELPIPATEKMVLLCLCDYANADGICWPGAESMAGRCSLTERTVRKCLKWLQDNGWISADQRPGRTAVYHIDPGSKFTPEANSPRNIKPKPRKQIPDTPEAASDEPSRTINRTINSSSRARKPVHEVPQPKGVDGGVWRDFKQHRKDKGAPLTETALAGIEREAAKAGWTLEAALIELMQRGWQGFKASWVKEKDNGQNIRTGSGAPLTNATASQERSTGSSMESFAKHIRLWSSMLPRRHADDIGGELIVRGFHRMLGHLSETQMGWLTEMVLAECKWFPTVAECNEMMGRKDYGNKFHGPPRGAIGTPEWLEADKLERAANRLELENNLKERRAAALEHLAALDGESMDRIATKGE
jgi:hypothetical protein